MSYDKEAANGTLSFFVEELAEARADARALAKLVERLTWRADDDVALSDEERALLERC